MEHITHYTSDSLYAVLVSENCSPQHGAGFAVVDNIRQIAHQYGSVKLFKAYLELSEQNSTKSLNLRSELQSCGVSLTDCPHNGRKDVADKMMIGACTLSYLHTFSLIVGLISGHVGVCNRHTCTCHRYSYLW